MYCAGSFILFKCILSSMAEMRKGRKVWCYKRSISISIQSCDVVNQLTEARTDKINLSLALAHLSFTTLGCNRCVVIVHLTVKAKRNNRRRTRGKRGRRNDIQGTSYAPATQIRVGVSGGWGLVT